MKEKQLSPMPGSLSRSCLLQADPSLCSLWFRVCPGLVTRGNPVVAVGWEWAVHVERGRVVSDT